MAKHPAVQLVIIGDGPLKDYLYNCARHLSITDRLMMAGYRDDASRYLACFKGLVLSSTTEGLPMVVLEAMRARVPIIATKVGEVPELLDGGNAGILLDRGDAYSIAQGMMKLIENVGYGAELAANAWIRLKKNYTSRLMAEKYYNIYQELLDDRVVCCE
jgi:glycosyltransferase involved in cell wall biosynthesis